MMPRKVGRCKTMQIRLHRFDDLIVHPINLKPEVEGVDGGAGNQDAVNYLIPNFETKDPNKRFDENGDLNLGQKLTKKFFRIFWICFTKNNSPVKVVGG